MRRHRAISLALAALALAALLLPGRSGAHQEDPKARNRQAPYAGPGYRRALGGGIGLAGGIPGFAAQGVTLLSWLPLAELASGLSSGNDCWGYVAPSGREYALIGTSGGTAVVEVTVPGDAQLIDFVVGPTSLWRDIKTYSTFAYAVSEGGEGIQVIDLSAVDAGIVTLTGTVQTGGTTATHNVAIDEVSGYLYRCGGASNGLRIYSLANPAVPALVGSWNDRYVHDVQVVTFTTGPYAGMQVAFACSGLNGGGVDTGLDILDVTVKSNIVSLGQVIYPNGQYSHQGWLSPDRQYFFLGDELDEPNLGVPTKTFIFDVSVLTAPALVGEFSNGSPAVGHNLYTLDELIFAANYRSGLRIFDATDPLAPVEVAFFDTYPADDGNAFNGLWSVYPYFPSGTVIGSDLERGLFVWRVGDPPLVFDYPAGTPSQVDPAGGTPLEVEITAANGFALDPASPLLWVDTGSGFVASPLGPVAGPLYQGTFPAAGCGEVVRWYVSAELASGTVVADPAAAPGIAYETPARLGEVALGFDDIESDLGWTVGAPGDTATTGIWVRTDPIGTDAQPEDDHTPAPGTICWVTGAGAPGGALGAADVDGGATTLLSPLYDLTATVEPVFGYWRWYSNQSGGNPGMDVFRVDISADGGQSWVAVETVGPSGPETGGGWFRHSFRAGDFVPLTAAVRLRFVAEDASPGSIVEAAVDDLELVDAVCVDCNGNGTDDSLDIAAGTSADLDGDGIPDECSSACPTPFVRGDANADLSLDISDASTVLIHLFSGGTIPDPLARADFDGGGAVDIADAIQILGYLFSGGPAPTTPFPTPGCP